MLCIVYNSFICFGFQTSMKLYQVWFTFIALPLEDAEMDAISVDDVGECVTSILKRPKQYYGKTVSLSADRLTMDKIVEVFNKHFDNRKFKDPKVKIVSLLYIQNRHVDLFLLHLG